MNYIHTHIRRYLCIDRVSGVILIVRVYWHSQHQFIGSKGRVNYVGSTNSCVCVK